MYNTKNWSATGWLINVKKVYLFLNAVKETCFIERSVYLPSFYDIHKSPQSPKKLRGNNAFTRKKLLDYHFYCFLTNLHYSNTARL